MNITLHLGRLQSPSYKYFARIDFILLKFGFPDIMVRTLSLIIETFLNKVFIPSPFQWKSLKNMLILSQTIENQP